MNPDKSWTPERVAILTRLWADNKSCAEIANALGGVTRNAVIGKAHRIKLPRRIDQSATEEKRRQQKAAWQSKGSPRAPKTNPKPQPTKVVAMPPTSDHVPFAQAARYTCHYAMDDPSIPGTADTPVCGAPKAEGGSFCAFHMKIVWRPKPERRKANVPNKTWGHGT